MEKGPLNNEFPSVSFQKWKNDLVAKGEVKGYDQLKGPTYEGFSLEPLYTEENSPSGPAFSLSVPPRPWEIWAHIRATNLKSAQEIMAQDLQGGVRHFLLSLPFQSSRDLDLLLKDFPFSPDPWKLSFDGGEDFLGPAALFFHFLRGRGFSSKDAQGSFYADPLGQLAEKGESFKGLSERMEDLEDLVRFGLKNFPLMNSLQIKSHIYHQAGASEVLDLALGLSSGIYYLRYLSERMGLSFHEALSQISFSWALAGDPFMGIAKMRAARVLWRHVLASCGMEERTPAPFYVRTSERVFTQRDPWMNILRETQTGFAGALAQVDGMVATPYDLYLKNPGKEGRRLSRNTQWILQKEAHLSAVMDPARGSYYLESLTWQMAQQGWEFFQKIESLGGMAPALESGWVREQIGQTILLREKNLHYRKEIITGVSQFPELEEKISLPDFPQSLQPPPASRSSQESISLWRASSKFESLRDQSDAYKKLHGHRPRVFLVSLGKLAEHLERTNFMKDFLEVGGLGMIPFAEENGLTSKVVQEFIKSNCLFAAVCGSDSAYQRWGKELLQELGKKASFTLLCSRPTDKEGQPHSWANGKGNVTFVYQGVDALDLLGELWQELKRKEKK